MKEQLVQANVMFDKEEHRYYIGTMELQGITRLLKAKFAPNLTYEFADTTVGTNAHEDIDAINTAVMYGIAPSPMTAHGYRYEEWLKKSGYRVIASEYIVTDGAKYASPIDNVYADAKDGIWIVDTKTYKAMTPLNRTMAQWQLSIYAHLFELQNNIKVDGAFILQVNDDRDPIRHDVSLIDREMVQGILYDPDFNPYSMAVENTTLSKVISLSDILDEYNRQKEAIESELETFKAKMVEEMKANKFLKVEQGRYKFAIVAESTTERFDSKRFKEEHADLYDKYKTTTVRSEYLKITRSKEGA